MQESGDAGEEFRQVTLAASFKKGVGLAGRAWQAEDLVFVADLGQLRDCVRAPAAQRVGVRSGICFPLLENGVVTGTMDFFATETLAPSTERLDTLRAIGKLVSQAIERVLAAEQQAEAARDLAAVNRVLRDIATATSRESAMTTALGTIREGFGWAYGSYWEVSDEDQALHFVTESGSAGQEFREVTLAASFKEGVGLSGRAWRTRDLVFVQDLAEVTDCVRAPAAQRAGVKSGVCLPIIVGGRVVGTMDFFATTTLDALPRSRGGAAQHRLPARPGPRAVHRRGTAGDGGRPAARVHHRDGAQRPVGDDGRQRRQAPDRGGQPAGRPASATPARTSARWSR